VHLDGTEGGGFDLDVELFNRRDEHMPPVRLPPQHGREQAHHRRPSDRLAFVKPGAVAGDAHSRIAAALRIPSVDRGQAAFIDQPLKLGEADPLQIDWWTALGHPAVIGLLRRSAQGRSAARWNVDEPQS